MYRRGRSGRDRSRDPSRPFSQGGGRDRERDYDRGSRNRDERHPSGHWQDVDRRGEGRRGDDRPTHLHPSLPSLLPPPSSGPPSGPAGHPPEQLPNYTRDASSKGPHARRESRESNSRDPLPPLDTARRHSGGPASLRKEFSEPSPRERGMIGDPQVGLPRRPISNTSWPRDRDDDRVRNDNRRSSLDRNLAGSPIVESPRSLQSPATSITATPTTTTTPTIAAATTAMAPSAPIHSTNTAASVDSKNISRLFQEACHAYIKYLEAHKNYTIAEEERRGHAEHFNTFPAMKDRYEGNANKARKDYASAQEFLREKSAPLDQFCRELTRERVSQRDAESAIEFCTQVKKELGNSTSLTQFIKSNTTSLVQGPSKDEFQQLRNELRDMKRKQEDEERMRQNFANEFHNYKNEQVNRLRNQDKRVERLESFQKELKDDIDRAKDEHRKTVEELKNTREMLITMHNSVDKLEKDASTERVKGAGDTLMADAGNDLGTLSGRIDEAFGRLETLQGGVIANQQKLEQTTSRFTDVEGDIKGLQERVSTLEVSEPKKAPQEDKVELLSDYATIVDIRRLEGQIHDQDEVLDKIQSSVENDATAILEEIAKIEQKAQTHIQTTGEKFQTLEQTINERLTNLLTLQESTKKQFAAELKGVGDKFAGHFANFHSKFTGDVERVEGRLGYVESQLEGHILAINHVDQRMNNFTTKDFYERVVQSLISINPMLFNYTSQLNSVTNEMKTIKETVRNLGGQIKQAEQRLNQSPRLAIQEGPNDPPNGALKSDLSSEGPIASFNTVLKDLETHANDIKRLDQRITDHIEVYLTKMHDIKEWTVSATQRLQEDADRATVIMDDIKELRNYLDTVFQNSESRMQVTNNSMDRWRAVGNNPDPIQMQMQGLPDENGNG